MTADRDWPSFAEAVAGLAGCPVDAVRPRTLLVEDLVLDSIALVELLVTLMPDTESPALVDVFDEWSWQDITAGRLFEEWRSAAPLRT